MHVLIYTSQLMHLELHPVAGDIFVCSFVYGASSRNKRNDLFQMPEGITVTPSKPWVVVGDFNCIANFYERLGHRVINSKIQSLRGCILNCGLHSIKYSGCFFTWSNKQTGTQ